MYIVQYTDIKEDRKCFHNHLNMSENLRNHNNRIDMAMLFWDEKKAHAVASLYHDSTGIKDVKVINLQEV